MAKMSGVTGRTGKVKDCEKGKKVVLRLGEGSYDFRFLSSS